MKNKIIITTVFAIFFCLVFAQKAKTEPNYSYKVHTLGNFSQVQKNVQNAQKDGQIIFIVDFSNSMNETMEGVPKLDIARATLAEILP